MHIEVFGLLGWILVILMDFSAEDDEAGNQMWVLHLSLSLHPEFSSINHGPV